MFISTLIDILDVDKYVQIDMMEDHDILAFFLGPNNDDIDEVTGHYTITDFSKYLCDITNLLNNMWQ